MAFSTQRATSDGTLSLLDISIEYFDRSEIAVLYDGVLQTSGWSWIGTTDKKVSFSPPVPNGVEVMLVRTTDLESVRHVFTLGAAFTTQSLDEDLKQILHIAQEARENATIEEMFHNLNMHGFRLVNVGPGIADTDAANMAQMNVAVTVAQAAAADAAASAATIDVPNLLSKAANLSDLASPSTARANLGAQATLLSGTNIKTVGGVSLMGSGDVPITPPASIPTGCILMWSGSIGTIPAGWTLCNGTNGTPDLRDRFVMAAGGTYSVGSSGDGSIPAHTHNAGTLATGTSGGHTHTVAGSSYATEGGPPGTVQSTGAGGVGTSYAGDHTHTITGSTGSTGSGTKVIATYFALAFIMKT